MRLVVVMKPEEGSELPSAEDLRRAGFAVSGAVGPAREEGPAPGPHDGRDEPGEGKPCGGEAQP
ncbi:MAG: hypothetical protein AB7E51_15685 [Pseudodesulfovibrio sp.]|uniref:Alanine dehydrogenase/pyridine nucleotide transhydrogenase N-terminal domain-containing protein n=1 Tax=Pseudodesulfovibrio indicus TaxID=1716143 RepID=A0A126QJT3_9BACT|nr:hypothetical protein [Pseudodesulfovibrio indicus]AMK10282.1 hypothetical protein AWY79_03690 [Pseudodesulfovibrio indicus]TDT82014.1 hypothetical protein EDC59_11833 [Pseudodesulfovibrio indicus]